MVADDDGIFLYPTLNISYVSMYLLWNVHFYFCDLDSELEFFFSAVLNIYVLYRNVQTYLYII